MTLSKTESPFTNSHWIWPTDHHWDIANSYALFRKTLRLRTLPPKAPLFITADQSYQLFINGFLVCRGPARGVQSHWPYDEIDIRPHLKRGQNILAVRAHHPGRSTFQYRTEGFAGLLIAAKWGKIQIASDETWKSLRQQSTRRDTVPSSMQLFNQEHVDLRLESGDWAALDFNDSTWEEPATRPWNSAPWFALEPRGIPLMDEKEILPAKILGVNQGTSAPGYQNVRDVVALRYQEDRSHHSAHTSNPSLLCVEPTDSGQFRSYLLDFGRTVVGHFTFEIQGAGGGEIIDTHYAETIDATTLTPDLVMPTHCRNAIGDRLICREGNATHTFYHPYGFRYVTVTVRDAVADFQIGLHFRWVGYPLERKGSFSSSDPDLERIWEACAWTQQCCALDAYVDTPWREQAQWWGDARVQAWNTFHLNGDTRLFRRGISQIAGQTTPDGVTYGHAPTMAHECILPDFTIIWMLTLWDYYWQTGSTEAFEAHHDVIKKALAYFEHQTDPKTGLIVNDPRYWLFLDWTDLFKDGAPTVYNLWLLIALEKMATLYTISGNRKAAVPLRAWAKNLRNALNRLVDKDGLLRDGINCRGKIVASKSIHSQTLGLLANLNALDSQAILDQVLLPFIRGEDQPKAFPSAYWITYVFSVLTERGYGTEVISFIKKYWLAMADHGTTWENYQPRRGDESHSHAWSSHPIYHLMQTAGGIIQTEPGWKKIVFRPTFHGESCQTTVPTPHGQITSKWHKKKGKFLVELKLPRSVLAKVMLPGHSEIAVSKGGKWIIEEPVFLSQNVTRETGFGIK